MPQRRPVTGMSREPRKRFAEELRARRAESGESLRELAERMGWDFSLFGKMESGRTTGGPEVVQALDDLYGLDGALIAMWELATADKGQFKERYREYMTLEEEASSIQQFAPGVVPGLLQTEAYAQEMLYLGESSGDLGQQVEARTSRRELLLLEDAPHYRALLDEAVLRRSLSDRDEWREQLEHLLMMGQRRNVEIQVLPFSANLGPMVNTDTAFLTLPDSPMMAWVETGFDGQLVAQARGVEILWRRYDRQRDHALAPQESARFITKLLEECHAQTPS